MGKHDPALIRDILSGNKEAYGALVKSHSPKLFRLAFRITGNEADADEVVQDAFLLGYRKLESFESRSNFGTWIYRIAAHCALNRLRGHKIEESSRVSDETDPETDSLQVADAAAGPERLILSGEIAAMQETAMLALTPAERAAFVLRHMEGCTTEEIALALGMEPNAAKQAVFRAVHKLRLRLAALRVNR
jgi:RNA polymerase sigma-70 factor (ECF subfamily)